MESAAGRPDELAEPSLFARKATGLVRGWAVRDAFIYAFFSINLVTLGFFIFTYAVFIPDGSLLWAVVLSGGYLLLQAVTYASLVAAMPRAGGDYIWISRTLGGGIGFVLAACGWWFILWHWVPIYANILNVEVIIPLSSIIGWDWAVDFFSQDKGLFWASVITAILASALVAVGVRTYARIQKFCFYGGLIGLAFMFVLLLINSKTDFISALNNEGASVVGGKGDLYAGTLKEGVGTSTADSVGNFGPISGIFLLIPFIVFFNLWSNWGATLYGEVRGASDFRKNIAAMGGALVVTTALAGISFLLFAKTFGWDFYNAANNAYWAGSGPIGFFPYPAQLASFFMGGAFWQFLLIGLMSLWFFGWVGTVFLSSTRVVFATAFDRVLPEAAANVSKSGVPYVALALMLIPSIPIAWLYAFNDTFFNWTLAATMVIAITFAGSAVAAAILPWRKPEIYNASPIAKYKVMGIPLITFTSTLFIAFLVFCLVKWLFDDIYGVNDGGSLIFMGSLYLLAIVIFAGSRVYRRRQGMDLSMAYGEIPAE
jgi:basic amino acid/polyamine antiporter, APA family